MTADELLDYAMPYLNKMFPSFSREIVTGVNVWREPYAQPIVEKFYSKLIPPFETAIPSVFLASMAQVYPEDRGTNYAIREGKLAAEKIAAGPPETRSNDHSARQPDSGDRGRTHR